MSPIYLHITSENCLFPINVEEFYLNKTRNTYDVHKAITCMGSSSTTCATSLRLFQLPFPISLCIVVCSASVSFQNPEEPRVFGCAAGGRAELRAAARLPRRAAPPVLGSLTALGPEARPSCSWWRSSEPNPIDDERASRPAAAH